MHSRDIRTIGRFFTAGILLLAAASVVLLVSCEEENTVKPPPPPEEIQIGALLASEGSASNLGKECEAAIELAEQDINNYLGDTDTLLFEINMVIEDTRSDPEQAQSGLQNFLNDDIHVILGPLTDAEAEHILPFANENNLLLISPSSLAINLAIEGDNLLRTAPDDSRQAEAIAALLEHDGVEAVIPLGIEEDWADDLLVSFTGKFEAEGGTVLEALRYDPETEDYAPVLDTLKDMIIDNAESYSDTSLAVYVLAGDEIALILNVQDHFVFEMENVHWYGTSRNARYSTLIMNSGMAGRARKVGGYPCPVYGEVEEYGYGEIKNKLEIELDRAPTAYAVAVYDALWVVVKAYLNLGAADPSFNELKQSIMETADSYEGVTGPMALNDAGDREYANFDFWRIEQDPDSPDINMWVRFARYIKEPGETTGTIVEIGG